MPASLRSADLSAPLAGRRVLVARPAGRAGDLLAALLADGAADMMGR